jgi:rRNA biogenesis protein RRP5
MKLLGAIREVNEFEVIISLPNGLTGFVNIFDVNDKLTSMLVSQEDKDENEEEEEVRDLP